MQSFHKLSVLSLLSNLPPPMWALLCKLLVETLLSKCLFGFVCFESFRCSTTLRPETGKQCSKSAPIHCPAIIKPISGCVCIACSSLMITSLLQVINRLNACGWSKLFIHKFDVSCFNNLQQVCKY